jgi:hypothetical protein
MYIVRVEDHAVGKDAPYWYDTFGANTLPEVVTVFGAVPVTVVQAAGVRAP